MSVDFVKPTPDSATIAVVCVGRNGAKTGVFRPGWLIAERSSHPSLRRASAEVAHSIFALALAEHPQFAEEKSRYGNREYNY